MGTDTVIACCKEELSLSLSCCPPMRTNPKMHPDQIVRDLSSPKARKERSPSPPHRQKPHTHTHTLTQQVFLLTYQDFHAALQTGLPSWKRKLQIHAMQKFEALRLYHFFPSPRKPQSHLGLVQTCRRMRNIPSQYSVMDSDTEC